MKPGATTCCAASITRMPASGVSDTASIRPPRIPTCLTASSFDSGSMTRPFATTRSYDALGCEGGAQPNAAAIAIRNINMRPSLSQPGTRGTKAPDAQYALYALVRTLDIIRCDDFTSRRTLVPGGCRRRCPVRPTRVAGAIAAGATVIWQGQTHHPLDPSSGFRDACLIAQHLHHAERRVLRALAHPDTADRRGDVGVEDRR